MVTMLDVISRESLRFKEIITNREGIFKLIKDYAKENKISRIQIVGSGSSYSASLSSAWFIEKATGLDTTVYYPELFINKSNYDKDALYLFVSQSGTSTLTTECASKLTKEGYNTLCVSSNKEAMLNKACKMFTSIECGYEEYTYATLGFSVTIFTLVLMAIELGKSIGHISEDEYKAYIDELSLVPGSVDKIIKDADAWTDKMKDEFLKAQNFVYYGGNNLFGIANEGALKMEEITKKFLSIGYELDDGMHGPNYCLDERTITFALNDGKLDKNCQSIMNLMKKEYKAGYMIGVNPIDDKDFVIDFKTSNFTNLEIVPVLQVLAYKMANYIGTPIYTRDDPRIQNTKGKGYFNMHAN